MTLVQIFQVVTSIVVTILVLGLVVLAHEIGHFVTARLSRIRVLEFGIGFPPRAKTIGRRGDTDYTLNWLPIGGFCRFEGEDTASEDPRAFSNASMPRQLVTLVAGVATNLLLAAVLFFFAIWLFNPAVGFHIAQVDAGSPAASVGLQKDQTVETVDGARFAWLSETDAAAVLRGHAGEVVQLGILDPDGSRHTVAVKLADQQTIDAGKGALGVQFYEVAIGGTMTTDPLRAAPQAVARTADTINGLVGALGNLGAGLLSHPSQAPAGVGGPVAIGRTIGFVLWDSGPAQLVLLAASLSASLAVMNLLPFPPLDGGRMLVLVLKRLFGRRGVSSLEATTYLVGFALLMAFIVWISFFDITNPAIR